MCNLVKILINTANSTWMKAMHENPNLVKQPNQNGLSHFQVFHTGKHSKTYSHTLLQGVVINLYLGVLFKSQSYCCFPTGNMPGTNTSLVCPLVFQSELPVENVHPCKPGPDQILQSGESIYSPRLWHQALLSTFRILHFFHLHILFCLPICTFCWSYLQLEWSLAMTLKGGGGGGGTLKMRKA